MKIAYVDTSVDGHHIAYLSAIVKSNGAENVLILPEKTDAVSCRQRVFQNKEPKKRTVKAFWKWITEIAEILKEENPDIVHFLYADAFYRFFGLGLGLFKKYHTVATFHWAKDGRVGKLSTKLICRSVDDVVVHSAYLKESFESCGAKNVTHIEYPQFKKNSVQKQESCDFWGLSADIPTIACVGHTRLDKGLDLLLEALQSVKSPFQLLIAGKEDAFDRAYIEEKAKPYLSNVRLALRYLSDEEVDYAFGACDIVALPYRGVFNGASGPLGEGVWLGKCIVGPNHKNLGHTIAQNHLGYTFETENIPSLAAALEQALAGNFYPDAAYLAYKESLKVVHFTQKYKDLYEFAMKRQRQGAYKCVNF